MNELLKQLAQEAAEHAIDAPVNETMITESAERRIEVPDTFLAKFAELVIENTLQAARAGMEFGPSMEDAVYHYFGMDQ